MKTFSIVLLLCVACCSLFGQGYVHPWSVTDGGGGKSSGDGYRLSTSVGQPAAGIGYGTGFQNEGGFVPGSAIIGGTTSTLTGALLNAWNLVSVPFLSSDMRKTTVYPTAVSNAFYYTPTGYVAKDTLQNSLAYWVKFASAQPISYSGSSHPAETTDVAIGWNMIGGISYPALTSGVIAIGTTVVTPYYGYTFTGYYGEDTLKPGVGYWTKVSAAGKLVVTAAPSMPPMSSPTISAAVKEHSPGKHLVNGEDELDGFVPITVTDANGAKRTVYFSAATKEIELQRFELPPLPPGGMLDVRFASQRNVEMPGTGARHEFPLQISGGTFPLTVTWNAAPNDKTSLLEIRDADNKVQQYPLSGEGSAVIVAENPAGVRVKVMSDPQLDLPKVFALYQNYPNPFNPATKIRYDVPKSSRITLKVFDMIGQEVETLVDEERESGRYTVEWKASGYPSGVYYYRLEAGSFSDVKKFLLMK